MIINGGKRRQSAEQPPTTQCIYVQESPRGGLIFVFLSSLSQSFECNTNLQRGLSHAYQYSKLPHYDHIISPGCPRDRLCAGGLVFPLPLNGRQMSQGTDLSHAGN